MLTNLNRGGVILALSDSLFDEINLTTHTCGRLFARALQRVAFVVSIVFLLGACQKDTLIPGNDEFETREWEEAINVDFTFGGVPEDRDDK